jgi:hypothetical protein
MTKVVIKKSNKSGKKLMAIFEDKKGNLNVKTIHFGAEGMSDFTKHKDPKRKDRYLKRHMKREDWNNPQTAGALSRWILWNKPTLTASIKDFKTRFKLK